MKKIALLLLILLTGCTSAAKEDYYKLSIDGYSVTVGYDNGEFMKIAYKYDIKDELAENEVVKDVNIYLLDDLLGVADISNSKNKVISYKDGKITKLVVYVNDLKDRSFKLNGQNN